MAIVFGVNSISLLGGFYSFGDIYQASITQSKSGYISKVGNSYEITASIFVGSSTSIATLMDTNVSVTILGNLFQIYKGSNLTLGSKRADGSTTAGCYLSMPNMELSYGFGYGYATAATNRKPELAGNLYLYASTLKAYSFWAFFSGDSQKVEIIDCIIDGYGRISGSNSILKNIKFERSHGRYGVLSPKGTLGTMENLSTLYVQADGVNNCSVYFNPVLAENMKVVGGTYGGYNKLVYTELNTTANRYSITFLDSNILNGYARFTQDNKSDMYINFTFNPILMDADGNLLSSAFIECKDVSGNLVFNSTTNSSGQISEEITYYKHTGNEANGVFKTPHTFKITHAEITITRVINMNRTLKQFPLFFTDSGNGSSTSSECNCEIIENKLESIKSSLESTIVENGYASVVPTNQEIANKLTLMESGIRQVIAEVSSTIIENKTTQEKTGFVITI